MIWDRSALDKVWREMMGGHDVCKTENYVTHSYHTRDRREIDDSRDIELMALEMKEAS